MIRCIIITAFALCLLASTAAAQDDEPLVGPISFEQLLELPGWFSVDNLNYRPETEYLEQIPQYIDDVEILCVVGTWCSDSRREVPRMYRLMQIQNIPPEKMRLVGVDRDKFSPGGETIGLGIERVPTFIFYRDGEEIGRIVETPYASLEKDMLGIIMTADGDNRTGETEVRTPDAMQVPGSDAASQQKHGEGERHEQPESTDPR